MPSGKRFDGKSGHSINPLCQELWNGRLNEIDLELANPTYGNRFAAYPAISTTNLSPLNHLTLTWDGYTTLDHRRQN